MSDREIALALRRCQAATRDFVLAICRNGGERTARKAERATYSVAFRELAGRDPTKDELDMMTGATPQEATR